MRELRNLMASTDTIQQGVRLAGEVDHPVSAPPGCAARVQGPALPSRPRLQQAMWELAATLALRQLDLNTAEMVRAGPWQTWHDCM